MGSVGDIEPVPVLSTRLAGAGSFFTTTLDRDNSPPQMDFPWERARIRLFRATSSA